MVNKEKKIFVSVKDLKYIRRQANPPRPFRGAGDCINRMHLKLDKIHQRVEEILSEKWSSKRSGELQNNFPDRFFILKVNHKDFHMVNHMENTRFKSSINTSIKSRHEI